MSFLYFQPMENKLKAGIIGATAFTGPELVSLLLRHPKVEIVWFFVMDDYGLIIGSPAMEVPDKGRIRVSRSTVEFRRPVTRGAYVFIRG